MSDWLGGGGGGGGGIRPGGGGGGGGAILPQSVPSSNITPIARTTSVDGSPENDIARAEKLCVSCG